MGLLFLREGYVLSSIRAKFIRGEEVKYISHLDLMKMYERALRRSGIPIAYSQGFNPHPQMVFGLPLSVGVTSESEFADFQMEGDVEPGEFVQRLNSNLPEGIRIVDAADKNTKSNIMASVAGASYDILVSTDSISDMGAIKELLRQLLDKEEIYIDKESKGKIKRIDIRPMIYDIDMSIMEIDGLSQTTTGGYSDIRKCQNLCLLRYAGVIKEEAQLLKLRSPSLVLCFKMLLAAGSAANLKPEFVIKAFADYSGYSFDILKIHRSGLFTGDKDKLMDPLNGSVILSI